VIQKRLGHKGIQITVDVYQALTLRHHQALPARSSVMP